SLRQRTSDLGHPHAVVIDQDQASSILWQRAERDSRICLAPGAVFQSLHQQDHAVEVRVAQEGATRSFFGRWVVACDGASSAVRQFMGIALPTVNLPQPWLVANITDRGEDHCVRIRCASDRASVTVPLPGGRRRIEMMLDDAQAQCTLNGQMVREHLARVWPAVEHEGLIDFALMRFRAGMAERWRDGRVFLAGDAAHVTPPFASQGLATGLRDAANLAFKLAGVIQGWLPETTLDTYEAERKPHQRRMIALALRLGWLMSPSSKLAGGAAHTGLGVLTRVPSLRGWFEMRGPDLRPTYDSTLVGGGHMSGRYLPQPVVEVRGGRSVGLDALLGPRMTWLQLGMGEKPGVQGDVPLSGGDVLLIEGIDFIDRNRTLQERYGAGALVLVRPDRIVHSHFGPSPAPRQDTRRMPWQSRLEPVSA
ncbi:MAG: FAD-dependent monooxygenase, partial [Phycisphaerales bacterium JB064]